MLVSTKPPPNSIYNVYTQGTNTRQQCRRLAKLASIAAKHKDNTSGSLFILMLNSTYFVLFVFLAFDTHDSLPAPTVKYERRQLSTFYTTAIKALGVLLDVQSSLTVMPIHDSDTLT